MPLSYPTRSASQVSQNLQLKLCLLGHWRSGNQNWSANKENDLSSDLPPGACIINANVSLKHRLPLVLIAVWMRRGKERNRVKKCQKVVDGFAICSQGQLSSSEHIRHALNPVNKRTLHQCFQHCYCTFKSLPLFENTCRRCGLQSHLWLGMMAKTS